MLQDDKRFSKFFELLFEIGEKADLPRMVVKGSYLVNNKMVAKFFKDIRKK